MIIAVGGRPNKLGCPGEELAVSSDDLFMLDHPPKKTLLVGASFIALECAGFLHHLGFDVTVMVRSILLRGFDQECAGKIGDYMKEEGIHFKQGFVPKELVKLPNGRILVRYQGSGFANSDITGEEEPTTKIVQTTNKSTEMYSDYARCYDAGCVGWVKDAEKNLYFLKCQQRYANDLLQIRGWVTLNDVYDMLGFPRSQAGQVVGWVYDKDNPQGDNYIDFGIYDLHKEGCRDFVNGFERSIWLDFNVDGYIFDKIKDRPRSR